MSVPGHKKGILRFAADRRSLGFAVTHFLLVAAAFALAPRGIYATLTIAVISWSSFMGLISGHNAMHSPVFHSRALNRAWQVMLSLTFCYPVSAFVPVHNLSHHMHLQTPKDVLRTTEVRHSTNILNLLHHVLQAAVHTHHLNAVYVHAMRKQKPVWYRQVRSEILAVLMLIAALCAIAPGKFLLFVLVPALLGQFTIFGFGYLQHDGTDHESEYDHSRNFRGAVLNFFILENGYHSIHHMKPGLHWSLGRAEHERLMAGRTHQGLEVESILAYLFQAYLAPGKRLRFDGAPVELPEAYSDRELWIPASALGVGAATGAVEG